jgi:WS/DGAT/MGAT family acyltransferase
VAASTLGKLLLLKPDPPTALRGRLGVVKRAAWSDPVPLRQVRALGQSLGGTSHEVLLCALAGALRRYLQGRGEPVSRARIRAAVPVNLRPGEAGPELGNVFGLALLPLPVHEGNVARRLSGLKKHWAILRQSEEARSTLEALRLLGLAPGAVGAAAIGLLSSKASVVISSVLGPHRPVSVDGKQVRQVLFWVPQAGGVGLGLSLFCYAGGVTLGVASDAGLVPDPSAVVSAFQEEIGQMGVLARLPGGRPARGQKQRRAKAAPARRKTKSPPDEQDSPP